MLYYPVLKGYWKQKELWDGTYTIDDWLEIMSYIPEEEKFKMQQNPMYILNEALKQ